MKTDNPGHKQKLEALRAAMGKAGLDGFIVPRIDKYQGEFVAPGAERLAWLTGFTGSAGTAVILKNKAAVFSDGRYTIQLSQQVDKALYHTEDNTKTLVSKWLAEHAPAGGVIGYDPWLATPSQIESMGKALAEKSITLKAVTDNLVDALWAGRPTMPQSKAEIFPEAVADASSAQKKDRIIQFLKDKNVFAAILNMPDSLAWLLNVRGGDIETTPIVLSMGIVHADGRPVQWFVDEAKLTPAVKAHLGNSVEIYRPDALEKQIVHLAAEVKKSGRPVGLDFTRAPVWFRDRLASEGAEVADLKDPCILPRAIKTPAEQKAIRAAHVADGVAIVKFLHWLEAEGPKGNITERDIESWLEHFRRQNPAYRGPSFSTIAGWAANGAIVHYRATAKTAAAIRPPGLLLVDSGGQYHYGTTDITRTIAVGPPTDDMRRHYTLVLKAHIAVAQARFPEGTTGITIDELARAPLKAEGLDYAHGTGHGVGCYLSVHEESANISARGTEALQAGMLLSNEPGYYREGHYGIRIENLVLVQKGEEGGLEFETVTLAPYDLNLIATDLLTVKEKNWVNEYHAQVLKTLVPKLDAESASFLRRAVKPLN